MCSGQREPTRYLSRAQLASPSAAGGGSAALRADYALLARIERARELAQGLVAAAEHGPGTAQVQQHLHEDGTAVDTARLQRRLRKALHDRGVSVIQAPAALSRHRRNRTAWDPRYGLLFVWQTLLHDNDG